MLSDLSLFQIYGAMARHSAEAQKTSAENLSRANEPGYKAVELESFADYLKRNGPMLEQIDFNQPFAQSLNTSAAAAPNGNTVSVEEQVFKSAEAVGKHNLALNVYAKSLDMMKLALGRRT
ncbi:MAG: flagellar biosynthesis protein FlgB [Pseudomonadota bacterium]